MDTMHDNELTRSIANNKRGSVNNANRLAAFQKSKADAKASWGPVDAERLKDIVVLITDLGGAVLFGTSRDQGAHSVLLILGGKKVPLYFNKDADLNDELDMVARTLAEDE